jgi:cytochrome b
VAPGAHAVLICDGAGWHAKSKDIVVPSNRVVVTSLIHRENLVAAMISGEKRGEDPS